MKNEEIIKRYCVQIRRPFCIQDVADNTNIEKSIVFGVIHKFLDEGQIERICDTERPKLYRWKPAEPAKIQNKPSYETIEKVRLYIESGKTHAEIAKEIGISRSSVSMAVKELIQSGVNFVKKPLTETQKLKKERKTIRQDLISKAEQVGVKVLVKRLTNAEIRRQIEYMERQYK